MSKSFRQLVEDEMSRCREKGCRSRSWHEAYGLIAEEVDEFWDEVKKKPNKRDRANLLKELVQIASLCERASYDLALMDDLNKDMLKDKTPQRRFLDGEV